MLMFATRVVMFSAFY